MELSELINEGKLKIEYLFDRYRELQYEMENEDSDSSDYIILKKEYDGMKDACESLQDNIDNERLSEEDELIQNSYFEEYAKDYVLFTLCKNDTSFGTWAIKNINWKNAIPRLKNDHESILISGIRFWYKLSD